MALWEKSSSQDKEHEDILDEQEFARVRVRIPPPEPDDIEPQASRGRLPQSNEEIKTLLRTENSVVHKKALGWKRKSFLLTARVECKRKLGLHQRNEIYNLVGFFIVFQEVLVHRGPGQDYGINSEETSFKVVVTRVNALRRDGPRFRSADYKGNQKKVGWYSVYATLVSTALVALAVVSHPIISCHSTTELAGCMQGFFACLPMCGSSPQPPWLTSRSLRPLASRTTFNQGFLTQ